MHWAWKNFPSAMPGKYKGKEKKKNFVLEAVANQQIWIFHTFFGTSGVLNKINVIQKLQLFED
jgi:hypothetical protein